MNAIYLGLTAASARERQLEVVANNLANASTNSFKKERLQFESVLLGEEAATGVQVRATVPDLSDGTLADTGRALDLALQGDGLVAVRGERGERYTRGGSLVIDGDGRLALTSGEVVVAETGRTLQVGKGNEERVTFSRQGDVLVDGASVGTLRLRAFARPEHLVPEGLGLYRVPPEAGAREAATTVHGGFLERSNINVTSGLVDMIRLQRGFEVQLQTMQQRDELASTTINEIGRVGR